MSDLELILVNENTNCTLYTIQFVTENDSEFERFYAKFKDDVEYNQDLMRIVAFIDKIANHGALERLFRPEGKINDGTVIITTNTIETNKTFDI